VRTLDSDRRANVAAAIARVARHGPTLGRPHVGTIRGSRVAKLKELRIDRGARVLFAFDSRRRPVMLIGGDKTGAWNRWYPPMIRAAEAALADHERSIGKEPRCPSRSRPARTPPRSR
jgi:hypothetical protein